MKRSSFLILIISALSSFSCGYQSRGQRHYDTTDVDTIVAVNLDSVKNKEGKIVTDWIYNSDSTTMTLSSLPQPKSIITSTNHMSLQLKYRGHELKNICLIMSDGERFAGNSYDSTNVVKLYAHGKELGKFTYEPGISKQTDTVFISSPSTFKKSLGENTNFKIETATFTSGTLMYEFNALSKYKEP